MRVIEQIAREVLGPILEDFKGHLHINLDNFSYRVPFQPQLFTDSAKGERLVDNLVSKLCFLFCLQWELNLHFLQWELTHLHMDT